MLYRISYFPELYSHTRKAEVDCFDYATKCNLKGSPGTNTSKFAKTIDLVNLKSDRLID